MSSIVNWKNEHKDCKVVRSDNPIKNQYGFVCFDHEDQILVDSSKFPEEFLYKFSCIGCEEEIRTGCLRVHTCGKQPVLAKQFLIFDDFSMTQHWFHD